MEAATAIMQKSLHMAQDEVIRQGEELASAQSRLFDSRVEVHASRSEVKMLKENLHIAECELKRKEGLLAEASNSAGESNITWQMIKSVTSVTASNRTLQKLLLLVGILAFLAKSQKALLVRRPLEVVHKLSTAALCVEASV